jgi:hypothetical protein
MHMRWCLPGQLKRELLVADEVHAEGPPRGHDVVDVQRLAAGGGDHEGERVAAERRVALPLGSPVAHHRDPPGVGALHRHGPDRAAAGNVADEHHLEVVEPGDGEPHASLPVALHPA